MPERGERLFGVTWDHRRTDRPHGPRLTRTVTMAVAAAAAVAIPLQASAASPSSNSITRARGADTSVVVRAAPAREQAAETAVLAAGGRVDVRIGLINGFAATVPQGALAELRGDTDILGITTNAAGHLLDDSYDPASDLGSMPSTTAKYGAQAYWSRGFTGRGVDVALIDSGVARVDGLTAPGKILIGPDLSGAPRGTQPGLDGFGHGTHMAGIIAGRDDAAVGGAYAGDTAHFLGMAPDSRLISLKVADADGNTNLVRMLAAIDWVVEHRRSDGLNIRVLNLSFGVDSSQPYTSDPLALAVEAAWKQGIFVTAAAGNDGLAAHPYGLADPAYDPMIMAVGASQSTDRQLVDDVVPGFSSTAPNSRSRRPNLVAPGAHIESLRAPGSYIDRTYGETGRINDRFFRGSGTSQAAAAVSGAAALVFAQHPDASPDQVKSLLTGTATVLPDASTNAQGSGVMNLSHALKAPLSSPRKPGRDSERSQRAAADGHPVGATAEGSSWSGSSWSGGSWSGSSWSGSSWSGSSWSGSSWSGSSWSGSSWSGSSWSGSSWSGSSWSGSSWSDLAWLSERWD